MSTKPPRIYLDHNAGAPLGGEARAEMAAAMAALVHGGNPSSIHGEGRRARDLVERARDAVAALAGVRRERVVFTSGGTEADALGLVGLARQARADGAPARLVCAAGEHPAMVGAIAQLAGEGFEAAWVAVDAHGRWRLDALDAALAGGAAVVAVAAVHHELGVVQPVAEILARARAAGARVLVDAAQAAGRLALAPFAAADAVALSAPKVGGPAGAGALIVGEALVMAAPWGGGPQERARRPGTENVVGLAGFGAAAAAVDLARWPAVVTLGDLLERGLIALGARIHGAGAPRVGGTISLGFPGAPGDVVVQALDLAGVAASTGAACSSGSVAASPALRALGQDEATAREAVRISLGVATTAAEVDAVLALLPPILARVRAA